MRLIARIQEMLVAGYLLEGWINDFDPKGIFRVQQEKLINTRGFGLWDIPDPGLLTKAPLSPSLLAMGEQPLLLQITLCSNRVAQAQHPEALSHGVICMLPKLS